jgi:hypothetical protein
MRAPNRLNKKKIKKIDNALTFPIIIEAKKTSIVVPKLAPIIKGIAFFKFMSLATAKGTKRLIVMLEEKTIAVRKTPKKYAFVFESKYLFIKDLVRFSSPKTFTKDLLKYFNARINIIKPKIKTKNSFVFSKRILRIGEVMMPTKLGILSKGRFLPTIEARKKEDFENIPKKNSNTNTIPMSIATYKE